MKANVYDISTRRTEYRERGKSNAMVCYSTWELRCTEVLAENVVLVHIKVSRNKQENIAVGHGAWLRAQHIILVYLFRSRWM